MFDIETASLRTRPFYCMRLFLFAVCIPLCLHVSQAQPWVCESAAGWSSTESFSDMHGMMSRQLMSCKSCFIVRAGDLQALKEKTFVIKEGAKYRLKIDFKVRWMDAVAESCWERMIYWRQQESIIVQIYIYRKNIIWSGIYGKPG